MSPYTITSSLPVPSSQTACCASPSNQDADRTFTIRRALFLALMLLTSLNAFSATNRVEDVQFVSQGVNLSGSIVFPEKDNIKVAVVFVHGSGKQTRNMHLASRFASQGIAVLVYDKRGAGRSGGEYEGNQSMSEKNLNLLADDAVAALNVLRKHPKTAGSLHGLTGMSQAGWIVPLAAEKSQHASFMVLWSGPVCKVSEEDIYSKHTADRDDKSVPRYSDALNARKHPYIWPAFLGKDTDPNESLVGLSIPGLWVFGERDGSIPVDLSMQNLKKQSEAGRKVEYVLFSNLGHENMSESLSTVTDWINRIKQ